MMRQLMCRLTGEHAWGPWLSCWPDTLIERTSCTKCQAKRVRRKGLT